MKRLLWVFAVPLFVCLVGFTGGPGLPADPARPVSITFGRLSAVPSCEDGYVPVQYHEIIIHSSIPGDRNIAMPDVLRSSLLDSSGFKADPSALNMVQQNITEEVMNMAIARKRSAAALMGMPKSADNLEKLSVAGFGNGWLGEAMSVEEKRALQEIQNQVMELDSEPLRGGAYSRSEMSIGGGSERSGRYVERYGESGGRLQNDGKSTAKPSFRFESWKPKK